MGARAPVLLRFQDHGDRVSFVVFKVRGGAEWRFWYSMDRVPCPKTGRLAFVATEAKRLPFPLEAAWKTTRVVCFGLRWKAKDRAWRWFCARSGRRFVSLHKAPRIGARDTKRRIQNFRREAP